ncbi:hypothetical protein FA95DRAFT_1567319 [Auriscalpium vulgare]|uniref:Uncharacterized protein n=1 Tax=Auriscalpium vulgare TaxID=40419 RepID=A0ACB8R5J8_9AGAM|nr:hypothetical protein FA95DRAFT_1567319 [Auriscalpium vulgare]
MESMLKQLNGYSERRRDGEQTQENGGEHQEQVGNMRPIRTRSRWHIGPLSAC